MTHVADSLVSFNNKHTHPPNPTERVVDRIKEKMKTRAKNEITPIPQIYHQTLQEVTKDQDREHIAPILPTFSSIKTSLYHKRYEALPPLPRTVEDINFDGDWSKMVNGEPFMLGSRAGVFLFSTQGIIKLIAEAATLYMDGTFQICPRLFYQVFTIHSFKHGQQFPLAYFLLPGKAHSSYTL